MPLPAPPSPLRGTRTREPSPVITEAAPGLPLRQPKCLMDYGRNKPLEERKGESGSNTHLEDSCLAVGDGQSMRRPNPTDKLLTYRRMRSRLQQGSPGVGYTTSAIQDDLAAKRAAALAETGISMEPLLLARLPKEMTGYIIDIEEQNRQLRQQVIELQEELQQEQRQQKGRIIMGPYRQPADAVGGNNHMVEMDAEKEEGYPYATDGFPLISGGSLSKEERDRYMNDVLAQVDVIVHAHRNQSEAMILKYKQEAEEAKIALKNLRELIALEGVDLSMLPAALATLSGPVLTAGSGGDNNNGNGSGDIRKTSTKFSTPSGVDTAIAGVVAVMNEKCAALLSEAVDVVLRDLLQVEAGDDVPTVVRQSVQRGFEMLARHLASVVIEYIRHCTEELRYTHKERETVCRELREELNLSERQRMRTARQYEAEIRALRDELHAFHVAAAGGDELRGTIHERALEEYTALLVDSRKEAETLGRQLEEERSDHATTCLRLKSSLQRRSLEFEEAVVQRAEELVRLRDANIAELQQRLDTLSHLEERRACGRSTKAVQVQAAESIVLDESNYMPNVISVASSLKGASPLPSQRLATPTQSGNHVTAAPFPSQLPLAPFTQPPMTPRIPGRVECAPQQENSFEEEVWAKTMELLAKYAHLSQN
ncbi:hypothetical protein TcYC6_0050790 [Trypanosoma cruzi]|nr:hypothetical protein TcYC6_0050790 [Trypanosoma cruzi]